MEETWVFKASLLTDFQQYILTDTVVRKTERKNNCEAECFNVL